ncbi:NAD-dependent 4,6-dehydratase LegB [Azospirillum soli]|uniref:NAD-dependent 4,6-dehydratase LegB n=1 Tax=Azospirillum soli TaxID=1304799 RepID=UPI001FE37ED4|nr:NAD-dependent 4,6-dehydratase LegB [Azospirillum soli]MBP2316265.1 dTDP-glucose 4,6-dehydratase [Azospirillum soli]
MEAEMTAQAPVLVTGAGGFVGSHLVEHLARSGRTVRALCHYNSRGSFGWLDELAPDVRGNVECVLGDVRDLNCVSEAVRDCDTIFHLAALIGIPYSYQAPQSYIDTNVTGTLNVLQAARACGVKRVVQTSTSEVYGTARFVPMTEEHPLNAQSPYAASKIAADQMALAYARSTGLAVSVIRPFNTFGPRQSARAVIPTIISQIMAGHRSIRLGALHPTRDFTFVTDTAAAFAAVAESPHTVGDVVNAGSGFEISIGDVAREIANVMNVDVNIETTSARVRPAASEVERLYADTDRIRRSTGWVPQYGELNGFRRGLRETVNWFVKEAGGLARQADRYVT